MIPLVVY